jgi:hypothetical protein
MKKMNPPLYCTALHINTSSPTKFQEKEKRNNMQVYRKIEKCSKKSPHMNKAERPLYNAKGLLCPDQVTHNNALDFSILLKISVIKAKKICFCYSWKRSLGEGRDIL